MPTRSKSNLWSAAEALSGRSCVIVEIKSTSVLPVDADRQLTNYLRASPMRVGLLLHFGPKARFLRRVHTTITPGP